ncbi:MAG TPA: SpoIIE family protein phosphatase [Candidatus Ozemobacteraceae bacterium]|nr:SpoIIE family protein phosphatase [Candidatus Ozemobacteraceae bacterium]
MANPPSFQALFSYPEIQELMRSLGEGIVISDTEMRVLYLNPTAEKLLNTTLEQIRGISLLGCHRNPSKVEELINMGELREPFRTEIQHGSHWLHVTATPLSIEKGKHFGATMIVSDHTLRHQLEERLRQQFKELSERQRLLDTQIALARQIQKSLQPPEIQAMPRASLRFWNTQSQVVGGDFAVASAPWIILGDVMGKGIFASQFVPLMIGFIGEETHKTDSPAQLLGALNQRLCSFIGDRFSLFVSLAALRWMPESSSLEIAMAGHEAPTVFRVDGTVQKLTQESVPLGVASSSTYFNSSVRLCDRDRVVLFSDGLTEPKVEQTYEQAVTRFIDKYNEKLRLGQDAFSATINELGAEAVHLQPGDDQTMLELEVRE